MLLHHVITVVLTSMAYYMNYVNVTHLILFVHDIGDVFLALGRAFADTTYNKFSIAAYIALLITWPYYRLYLYPSEMLWVSCYGNPRFDVIYGMEILGLMAHILLILHIYWYYVILTYAKNVLFKGTTDDKHHFGRKNKDKEVR
jgi:hypothetical protein